MSFSESGAGMESREGRTQEGWPDLLALVAAAVLAAAGLYLAFHGRTTRFEDLALDDQTTGVFAAVDGSPIHCMDMTDLPTCLPGFERRASRAAALWVGNSQLHAVNQWSPGQETAPGLLASRLRSQGVDLLTVSPPNGNFREHLVLYAYARSRLPLQLLLMPAVFDDLRNATIRPSITPALADPGTIQVLERSGPGRQILASNASTADPDRRALAQTVQERSEAFLDGWLKAHWPLWAVRPEARGELFLRLYEVRNSIFGITPNTKRRLIAGNYALNMAALEATLEDAQHASIRVVTYVAPLRDDIETPYEPGEYARFKHDIEQLAERYGAAFVNLEGIVPPSLWGVTRATTLGADTEVDFMHFQAGGHSILADRLTEVLELARNGRPQ